MLSHQGSQRFGQTFPGTYAGAAKLVKTILEQERLIAADRDPEGCILMNIHKAKGKEFDGVVLVEGAYKAAFFDEREKPLYPQSRRLLRSRHNTRTRARNNHPAKRRASSRPLEGQGMRQSAIGQPPPDHSRGQRSQMAN